MRALAISLSLILVGCPRPVPPRDGGPEGCVANAGNPLDGPIVLDDDRVSATDPSCLPAGAAPCLPPHLGRVTSVVDGDTLRVEGTVPEVFLMNVRMIGVDTPEVGHGGDPSDCFGEAAAEFTRQLQGHLVWLTFDAECIDPFNRRLAYVHIGDGTGDLWERQLLSRGMARVLTIAPNNSYATTFEQDEARAQSGDVGLWGSCF
jgi:micrococcal nuclease